MAKKEQSKTTNTDQTVLRDSKGRFKKGSKPKNGFDKNPKNIAPGGFWRYKEHGKSAIIDIFKMSLSDFNKLDEINDNSKTVLDATLYVKFKAAMNGSSRDMDFLFNQAFGESPKYREAQDQHYQVFESRKNNAAFESLTKEDIKKLLSIKKNN